MNSWQRYAGQSTELNLDEAWTYKQDVKLWEMIHNVGEAKGLTGTCLRHFPIYLTGKQQSPTLPHWCEEKMKIRLNCVPGHVSAYA